MQGGMVGLSTPPHTIKKNKKKIYSNFNLILLVKLHTLYISKLSNQILDTS